LNTRADIYRQYPNNRNYDFIFTILILISVNR